jgi:hypothetical protein
VLNGSPELDYNILYMLYNGASKSRLDENPFDARSDQGCSGRAIAARVPPLDRKFNRLAPRKTSEARWPGTVISGRLTRFRLARTQGGAAFCGQPIAPEGNEDDLRWPVAAASGRRAASGLVGCKDGGPQCR